MPHGSLSQCLSDLNGNQTVDNDDLLILLAQYGVHCSDIPWLDPVISEILYNPSTLQGDDSAYEFIELMNPHGVDLNLSGWSLSDGVDATFPPGTWVEGGGWRVPGHRQRHLNVPRDARPLRSTHPMERHLQPPQQR